MPDPHSPSARPEQGPAGNATASAGNATASAGNPTASAAILDEFAIETGLASRRPPRRYLWTDAFAVCGFLGLHTETRQRRYLDLALALIDQVHHRLGRHRADDPRSGWISGLDERAGAEHPTAGGLRIGKAEPERMPGQAYDPRREWNRDGQYYHYLTRWMHALNRAWSVTRQDRYHRWAVELAGAAHRGFVQRSGGRPWIVWKMSIDLSRPLVHSAGQHDPLDGRTVVETLRATAPDGAAAGNGVLDAEATELDAMCRDRTWATDDALGIGGLLTDCLRLAQLRALGHPIDPDIEAAVFRDAKRSLLAYADARLAIGSAEHRLAFRELGLAIGLHAAERVARDAIPLDEARGDRLARRVAAALTEPGPMWRHAVRAQLPLAPQIEQFWMRAENRRAAAWTEHRDINAVMLAVSLTPDGYLDL